MEIITGGVTAAKGFKAAAAAAPLWPDSILFFRKFSK